MKREEREAGEKREESRYHHRLALWLVGCQSCHCPVPLLFFINENRMLVSIISTAFTMVVDRVQDVLIKLTTETQLSNNYQERNL